MMSMKNIPSWYGVPTDFQVKKYQGKSRRIKADHKTPDYEPTIFKYNMENFSGSSVRG